jgi:hypothetical protein
MIRQWWVRAVARKTGHPSRVGPFKYAVLAGEYADKYRHANDWKLVMVTSTIQNIIPDER